MKLFARTSRLRLGLFVVIFLAVLMMGEKLVDSAHLIFAGKMPEMNAANAADADPKKDAAKKEEPKKDDAKKDAPSADVKADASAEAKTDAAKPADAPAADAKADTKPDAAKTEAPAAAPAAPAPEAAAPVPAPTPAPAPAADSGAPAVQDPQMVDPDAYSDAEVNILKRLSERRQELDKRGRELDQREALLKVTESRVDRKISDLKAMQADVRKIIGEADDKQKAEITSMVKIYETMKPKDAATILEKLDIDTLVNVVSRMKEARVAPVLAAMDPVKGKELTSALMNHKPLPTPP